MKRKSRKSKKISTKSHWKRWWVFALLLLPSILLVELANYYLHPILMNSFSMFKVFSFILLFALTFILGRVVLFIEQRIRKRLWKRLFVTLFVIIAGFFSLIALSNLVFNGLFTFKSCGEDFNERYLTAAQNNDASLCFEDVEFNYFRGPKGRHFCMTPNKDLIQVLRPFDDIPGTPSSFDREEYEQHRYALQVSSCVNSLAEYTEDISVCDSLDELKADFSKLPMVGKERLKAECNFNYAISFDEQAACESILETKYKDKQDLYESCVDEILS